MENTVLSGGIPKLVKILGYFALLLEAIIAELRYLRGMKSREVQFFAEGSADCHLYLDELQAKRRALFPET